MRQQTCHLQFSAIRDDSQRIICINFLLVWIRSSASQSFTEWSNSHETSNQHLIQWIAKTLGQNSTSSWPPRPWVYTHFGTHVMTLCKRTGDLFRSYDGAEPTKQILERDFVGNDFLFHSGAKEWPTKWTQKSSKNRLKRCPVPGSAVKLGESIFRKPGNLTGYVKGTLRLKTVGMLTIMLRISTKKITKKNTPTSRVRCFFLQIHFLSPSSHTMSPDRSSGKDRGYAIWAIRHWMQVRFGPILAPKKVLRSLTYCSQVVPTLIDNWWYNIGNLKLSPPCVLCVCFEFPIELFSGPAGDIQINIDNKHLVVEVWLFPSPWLSRWLRRWGLRNGNF